MGWIEVVLCFAAGLYLLYKWGTLKYRTFEERGLPHEKPLPLMGNANRIMLNKESFFKTLIDLYRKHKLSKVFGFYNFRDPIFIVMDPDSIKKITVKDFDYFPNHSPVFGSQGEPLWDSMLNFMKDQRWKNMRGLLTPVFTASKMRSMFSLMNECFDESLNHLRDLASGEVCEIEMKDCFTRLSNDIIASTAFGLKINSYVDLDNEFYNVGQSITAMKGKQLLKFLFSVVAPKLMHLLGFKVFAPDKTEYFMRLVLGTMKYRKDNNVVRPDMIQMLMEAKKESTQNWSDEELVAQCFIFFFAAFENNTNLICTTCHELMDNPDIQQRLYEECLEVRAELNGAPLDYDVVNKMKYMDMVVSESLRKWSLTPFTDRLCSKDYALKDEDGQLICQFKTGDRIWIPIIGLNWDEDNFKNPEEFDPERFSEENKNSIKPFTYLPFGVGPRVCIGNRYALMQAKAILYNLILDFKLERSSKSSKDLLKDSRGFSINPPNGFWMRVIPRK